MFRVLILGSHNWKLAWNTFDESSAYAFCSGLAAAGEKRAYKIVRPDHTETFVRHLKSLEVV